MTWWEAILLGALQGVTEFLPISSSGHLVLAQQFLAFSDTTHANGAALFFDGILHLGTLAAVLLYFRRGLRQQIDQHLGRTPTEKHIWPATGRELLHLAWLVGLATLPAALAAARWSESIKESFNDPQHVAMHFLILALILLVADRIRHGRTTGPQTRWWQALLIGMAQAVSALVRGLSRSGLTMTMALAVGLDRDWAIRFSFLMSILASLGLAMLGTLKALTDPDLARWMTPQFLLMTLLATAVSGVVAYLTIEPLIRLVRHCRLWWFSIYLWLLGGSVLLSHLWE